MNAIAEVDGASRPILLLENCCSNFNGTLSSSPHIILIVILVIIVVVIMISLHIQADQ